MAEEKPLVPYLNDLFLDLFCQEIGLNEEPKMAINQPKSR
jgi:hypothetical protein